MIEFMSQNCAATCGFCPGAEFGKGGAASTIPASAATTVIIGLLLVIH